MAKIEGQRVYSIPVDIWNSQVYVIVPANNDSLSRIIKKKFKVDWKASTSNSWAGLCIPLDRSDAASACVIGLREFDPENAWDISVLTHEMFHAVVNILSRRATPLCDDTEEAYAYLLSNLVQSALYKLTNYYDQPSK